MITGYIGRENTARVYIKQQGALVNPGVVTRVMLKFGTYCLDTNEAEHPITLGADGTYYDVRIGLVENIAVGSYKAITTVFTASDAVGLAWPKSAKVNNIKIKIIPWDVCPVPETP